MPLIPDQGEKREGEATEANIWHRKKGGRQRGNRGVREGQMER